MTRLTTTQCHTHAKVRDAPKRRRETNNHRDSTISTTSVASSRYVTEEEDVEQEVKQDPATTSDDLKTEREATPRPDVAFATTLAGPKVASSLADFASMI
jgi:hypothetical protein